MCQIETKNYNTGCEIFFRDNVKQYVNYFFAESGTTILLRIKQYKADPVLQKSLLKNVFKDKSIKDSLKRNLENLLEKFGYKEEYRRILWYAFSSNTNPDFEILLQRFMISVPPHADKIEDKIDKDKWGLLEDEKQKNIHENGRLGIYARYRSGDIPRDKERVVLINANEGVGLNLKDNWRNDVLNEEKRGTFYLWLNDETECKKALYTANLTIVEDDHREKFYEYMKFIWNGIDLGEDAMLLYTAKPIAYASGGIPEHSIGEVYLAEYQKPLSKLARDIVIDYFENIALILHAQFAREDMVELWKNKEYIKLLIERNKSAIYTAISQVMARNMSHNIGSHVLSKLIKWFQVHGILKKDGEWQYNEAYKKSKIEKNFFDDLHKVLARLESGCDLKEGFTDIETCLKTVNQLLSLQEEVVFNNYILLADFFQYLKARMDFLADVTMNTPVIENTKGIYNDIIKPFINNRILNDRISGIDEFRYDIIVCMPPLNKGEYCVNHTSEKCRNSLKVISSSNDVILSIPNDILGSHAFYTILENIIRNTAKHGASPFEKDEKGNIKKDKYGNQIKQPVEFKIKVEEAVKYKDFNTGSVYREESKELDWNEFYAISIFDNCDLSNYISDISKWTSAEKEEAGYKKNRKKIPRIQELVVRQNKHLNDSILQKNQLRHGAWGLIEMDASAAYLRKIDVELIDSDKYQIVCLQGESPVTADGELAILQAYAEQEKYLGYRFFIRKPQEILIVGDNKDLGIEKLSEDEKRGVIAKCKNEGIWIYDKKSFLTFFADKKQKVFPHKLVVLLDSNKEIREFIKNHLACFSKRIYLTESLSIIDNLKLYLWIKYYQKNKTKSYNDETKIEFNDEIIEVFEPNGLERTDDYHGSQYCNYFKVKNHYVEITTSATEHLVYTRTKNKSKIHKLNERAAEPINILVIDERIQDFTKSSYSIIKDKEGCLARKEDAFAKCFHEEGVPYQIIYERTNIDVPRKGVCNLNVQNFSEKDKNGKTQNAKIVNYIQEFLLNQNVKESNHFFVIIHLGIIEKLINSHSKKFFDKDDPEQTRDFITEVLLKKNGKDIGLCQYFDNIVVTSGRGTPQNVPKSIRYLNFSAISQHIITLRNKYALTEVLYSSRSSN